MRIISVWTAVQGNNEKNFPG